MPAPKNYNADDSMEKRYYSIGEVSTIFKVNKSLIRFWESEFEILRPHKGSKGERRYTQANLDQLQVIYDLVKVKGFTLDGAKKELRGRLQLQEQKNHHVKNLESMRNYLSHLLG